MELFLYDTSNHNTPGAASETLGMDFPPESVYQ